MDSQESYPLPEDPALADAARAIRDAGHWGWIVDDRWRLVYASDELRLSFGALVEYASFPIDAYAFGADAITTSGRAEVNALGDQVNEAARIEACATGGLALVSKDLVERLEPEDAAALGLDPDRVTYTPLGGLATATEKARCDAPAIAVCEI